ncbi:hypothetical protein CPB86DRAFT_786068 [Serendipita vermifera]|nr:hypothetical protein CPB86DRAFT_786068 [Serendipita vermifera]
MSVDNSLWSAVGGNEQSYASIGSIDDTSSGDIITSEDKRIEYVPPPEPDYDPLIQIPDSEEEQNEKMKEILANLRLAIQQVQEEAEFSNHLEGFIKQAMQSNLAGEPRPSSKDIGQILKELDGVTLGDPERTQ